MCPGLPSRVRVSSSKVSRPWWRVAERPLRADYSHRITRGVLSRPVRVVSDFRLRGAFWIRPNHPSLCPTCSSEESAYCPNQYTGTLMPPNDSHPIYPRPSPSNGDAKPEWSATNVFSHRVGWRFRSQSSSSERRHRVVPGPRRTGSGKSVSLLHRQIVVRDTA